MSRRQSKQVFAFLVTASLMLLLAVMATAQDKTSIADKIKKAAAQANSQQKYQLEYKLQKGQELRWQIEQTASTKLQSKEVNEESSSRGISVKHWKVANVDSIGNMTFVHSFESANMWKKTGDEDPITYNSIKDKEAPADYKGTAELIGIPLASITINKQGQIVDRKSERKNVNFLGDPVIPVPAEAISVGHKWLVPKQLSAKDENGSPVQLKAQMRYTLTKVKMPNAYITFQMEVLTPIESETVKSQIMQQIQKGYFVFDIKRGIPVIREAQWDEKALGFRGTDSFLSYIGKMKEKYMEGAATQQSSVGKAKEKVADIKKSSDSKPVIRK